MPTRNAGYVPRFGIQSRHAKKLAVIFGICRNQHHFSVFGLADDHIINHDDLPLTKTGPATLDPLPFPIFKPDSFKSSIADPKRHLPFHSGVRELGFQDPI